MPVKETLHAVKVNDESSLIWLTHGNYIGEGKEGQVHRARLSWKTSKDHVIERGFIYKTLDFPEDAESLQMIHHVCQDAGLPVVRTYRIAVEDDLTIKGILMTDLTEGGKKVVISQESFRYNNNNLLSKGYEGFKKKFMSLNFSKSGPLGHRLEEYARIAASHGILLTQADAWFLQLGLEGEAQLKLGDFGSLGVGEKGVDGNYINFKVRGPFFRKKLLPQKLFTDGLTQDEIFEINNATNKRFLLKMNVFKTFMRLKVLGLLMQ